MPQSRFSHAVIGMAIGLGIGAVLQFNTGAAPQSAAPQPASPQAKPAGRLAFTEPAPFDFNDHDGYVSLFDGISLKGWDGNPKFWRVEDGAIVGESTPANPERQQLHRLSQSRGKGLHAEVRDQGRRRRRERPSIPEQDRHSVARPNSRPPSPRTSDPVNLDWMMTGPQADFWPSRIYTGQFYSENTPMRILAWRGQVVEGFGAKSKKLMGTIGDRTALGKLVKHERLEPVHRSSPAAARSSTS